MKECFPDRSGTARDILSYLSGLPDAQDTLDSIVRWRLKGQKSDEHTTLVKEVLADLVTQGRIKKVKLEGQAPYYRVHPDPKK
jgi:hypothetical protein